MTITIKKGTKSFSYFLLDIITVLLLALIFIPQFKFLSFYNYLCLLLTVLWCCIAFIKNINFVLKDCSYFVISITFFLIAAFIPFLVGNYLMVNRYSSFVLIPLFHWIYLYNTKYRSIGANFKIIFFSSLFILYTTIQTIFELLVNPFAARSIKTAAEETEELSLNGVSGYSLIYAVVILLIAIFPLLLDRKKIGISKKYFFIILLLFFLFFYLVVLSNYFTALIVSMAGLLSIFILYKNKNMFVFLLLFSSFYFFFKNEINILMIDTISSFIQEDGITHKRLGEIKLNLLTGATTESVDSRSEVTSNSIDLFLENPILGYASISVNEFNLDRLGQHSYIIDTFALYGLFLGIFSFWILWLPFQNRILKKYSYKLRVYSWIVGIVFISLITFNNMTASMGYIAFFVFPTVFDYIKQNENG